MTHRTPVLPRTGATARYTTGTGATAVAIVAGFLLFAHGSALLAWMVGA